MDNIIANADSYRVGLYIRLSKEDDSDTMSESVINQRSLLRSFAERQKLEIFDEYIDDGWSGTSFERPSFKRMIRDIDDGRVNMVITKDLSRLGRDYIMTGYYMERFFPEKRVRYVSLLDGIDTGSESSANDITPFRAIMNDMYAKDISKKIKSVKRDKQQKGMFIGGKAIYGYRKHPTEKNKIVTDEEAARTVRYIFSLALDGKSARAIAAKLNEEHIPPPSVYAGLSPSGVGKRTRCWSGERISEMLKNEIYMGNMVQGRRARISYKSAKSLSIPKEKWAVVNNTHEPIIDSAVFARVGKILDARSNTRSRSYDFPLKGLVFCHECGRPLSVLNRKNAAGEDVLFFACRSYLKNGRAGACTCHSIKVKTVSDAVENELRMRCGDYLNSRLLVPSAKTTLEEMTAKMADTGRTEEAIRALSLKIDRLCCDKLDYKMDEKDFLRIYLRLKTQRQELEKRLEAIKPEDAETPKISRRAVELTEDFLNNIASNRGLLSCLIEKIEFTKEKKLIIRFRFSEPEAE